MSWSMLAWRAMREVLLGLYIAPGSLGLALGLTALWRCAGRRRAARPGARDSRDAGTSLGDEACGIVLADARTTSTGVAVLTYEPA